MYVYIYIYICIYMSSTYDSSYYFCRIWYSVSKVTPNNELKYICNVHTYIIYIYIQMHIYVNIHIYIYIYIYIYIDR